MDAVEKWLVDQAHEHPEGVARNAILLVASRFHYETGLHTGDGTAAMTHAFLHFFHMDKANAAFHCADVRFSPITFRLQEALYSGPRDAKRMEPGALLDALYEVYAHNGSYAEDPGR